MSYRALEPDAGRLAQGCRPQHASGHHHLHKPLDGFRTPDFWQTAHVENGDVALPVSELIGGPPVFVLSRPLVASAPA
jgi:hypothetical protein